MQARESGARRVHGGAAKEKCEDAHGRFVFFQEFAVDVPAFGEDARIFRGGHAFLVEVRHHFLEAIALLIVRVRRNQVDDQVHGRIFLEHTGGTAL